MEQNYYDKNARSFFDETVNIDLSGLYDTFSAYLDKGARILDAKYVVNPLLITIKLNYKLIT